MFGDFTTYVYNNLPHANGISPSDIFYGSRIPRHKLRDLDVWGCRFYVLEPKLQSGKKIPRWEPRSKQGVFCGLSTIHSSEVPQVLNPVTGSITTQFHVVFDNLFSTVTSIEKEEDPPSHREDLYLENTVFIPTDNDVPLSQEWNFSIEETEKNTRNEIREQQVR